MAYISMLILNLIGLKLPSPVVSLAQIIRGANTFIAMLMIGVGLNLNFSITQLHKLLKVLTVRYGIAAVLACLFYFLLPFSLEIRQTLVLLAFSPITSSAPAFTEELKSDVGMSSTINSISILCSIVFMTVLMLIML